MSTLSEMTNDINARGKSVANFVFDMIEDGNERMLTLAEDYMEFALAQARLPVEVDSFVEYRERLQKLYADFGETLKSHAREAFEALRDAPQELRDSVKVEPKAEPKRAAAPKRSAAPKKRKTTAAKKKPSKRSASKAK